MPTYNEDGTLLDEKKLFDHESTASQVRLGCLKLIQIVDALDNASMPNVRDTILSTFKNRDEMVKVLVQLKILTEFIPLIKNSLLVELLISHLESPNGD